MRSLALAAVILLGHCSLASAQTQSFGNPAYVFQASLYKNITTDGTFAALKTGSGVLDAICINNTAAGETITIYDSVSATSTKIGTITLAAGTLPGCIPYFAQFAIGLTVVTAVAAGDITVLWK